MGEIGKILYQNYPFKTILQGRKESNLYEEIEMIVSLISRFYKYYG